MGGAAGQMAGAGNRVPRTGEIHLIRRSNRGANGALVAL
jgi:hypothetical protein